MPLILKWVCPRTGDEFRFEDRQKYLDHLDELAHRNRALVSRRGVRLAAEKWPSVLTSGRKCSTFEDAQEWLADAFPDILYNAPTVIEYYGVFSRPPYLNGKVEVSITNVSVVASTSHPGWKATLQITGDDLAKPNRYSGKMQRTISNADSIYYEALRDLGFVPHRTTNSAKAPNILEAEVNIGIGVFPLIHFRDKLCEEDEFVRSQIT